jgi:hypothetical protein
MTNTIRRALACALGAIAVLTVAPSAHAGVLAASATDCEAQTLERPFQRWLDPARYVLAPGGTFEAGSEPWALSGGAAVTDGNEPFYIHAAGERSSLSLAPGSSATSPWMCVGIEHPTLRFVARNTGSLLGALRVDVRFEDALGNERMLTIGRVIGHDRWAPTLPMPVLANLLALLPGEKTPVAFRFTPEGYRSSWRIDDVYVDPYCKG